MRVLLSDLQATLTNQASEIAKTGSNSILDMNAF